MIHSRQFFSLLSLVLLTCIAIVDVGNSRGAPAFPNLINNPSFETGSTAPNMWQTFETTPGLATFGWISDANTGQYGVSISKSAPGVALWHQAVTVAEGTVYLFNGYVGWDSIAVGSSCFLGVDFVGNSGQLLERINYHAHTGGTRDYDLDYPTKLKVRAPAGAVNAKITLILNGEGTVKFDDIYFGKAPLGTISGLVTENSIPLAGATVKIVGDPWGKVYSATTDSSGNYVLPGVPVTQPRYILLASKPGYRTRSVGEIGVSDNGVTTVDFTLQPGVDPRDVLNVKFGSLSHIVSHAPEELTAAAVVPAGAEGYPASVRAFLEPDEKVASNHPDIVTKANEIVQSLPPAQQSNTLALVTAFYQWNALNNDHGSVYSNDTEGLATAFRDPTTGILQTIGEEGGAGDVWGYGRNMTDWLYSPHELMATREGICVEHALLATAMLRAMNIPARPFSGALEFWAQTNDTDGAWYTFSASGGRVAYRDTGSLTPNFSKGSLRSFPVTPGAMCHEDWDWETPGLWRERHPWTEKYTYSTGGRDAAVDDLATFSASGVTPHSGDVIPPAVDSYQIDYRDITLGLYDMITQTVVDVRFPLAPNNEYYLSEEEYGYWTNHPECVTGTYIETVTPSPDVEFTEQWFHIVFDVSSLFLPKAEFPWHLYIPAITQH